jgi:hypothetical protein
MWLSVAITLPLRIEQARASKKAMVGGQRIDAKFARR